MKLAHVPCGEETLMQLYGMQVDFVRKLMIDDDVASTIAVRFLIAVPAVWWKDRALKTPGYRIGSRVLQGKRGP